MQRQKGFFRRNFCLDGSLQLNFGQTSKSSYSMKSSDILEELFQVANVLSDTLWSIRMS